MIQVKDAKLYALQMDYVLNVDLGILCQDINASESNSETIHAIYNKIMKYVLFAKMGIDNKMVFVICHRVKPYLLAITSIAIAMDPI